MPVTNNPKRYITDIDGNIMTCCLCGADAWYDINSDRFEFACPCGELDTSLLPENWEDEIDG